MWLLNSISWELKEFLSQRDCPPYAILSHTWGPDEVSFREWQEQPTTLVQKKEGFKKIEYCCVQAASEGLEWVWIDTCCIDKSSSAELSEAINSMFRWYRNAQVCYAYLSDVFHVRQRSEIELALMRCHWVTRGWTLQELIAPSEVIFYSRSWDFFGTRSGLSGLLASITRIHEPYLQGRSLQNASIAQRMSWAAKRSTTREEDTAYCLLGLFDVNMPLLYGEGPKAFRRLQQIIAHEYPRDLTLFAWGRLCRDYPKHYMDRETAEDWKPTTDLQSDHDHKLHGLLAQCPGDFRDSGEIVCAPDTGFFEEQDGVRVPYLPPTFIGKTTHINLPLCYNNDVVEVTNTIPKTIRLVETRDIVLPCGIWNNLYGTFHYTAIPCIAYKPQTARFYEIVLTPRHSWSGTPGVVLGYSRTRLEIAPIPTPLRLKSGDILFRRKLLLAEMRCSKISARCEHFRMHKCLRHYGQNYLVLQADFHQLSASIGLALCVSRSSLSVSSVATAPVTATSQGLAIGITPISAVERDGCIVSIRSTKLGCTPLCEDNVKAPYFSFNDTAAGNVIDRPDLSRYKVDMLAPYNEWEFEILGVGKLKICVENVRIELEHDLNLSDQASHGYVHVIDMVVKGNYDWLRQIGHLNYRFG